MSKTAAEGLILDNDTDSDGDNLVISNFHAGDTNEKSPRIGQFNTELYGNYGQLTLQTNGSYSYTANTAASDALATGEIGTDIFSYRVSDSKLADSAELEITVTGINDTPSLVDATKKKKYTEGQSNVTVIDGSLDINDPDDNNIESASVRVSSDTYQITEDELRFNDAYGIQGVWNAATGILSLTGSTSISNYIKALESVTYTNTNNINPVIGEREIEWKVNDGEADSIGVTSIVDVGGDNDAPESNDEAVAVDASSTISTPTQTNLLTNDTDPEGDSLSILKFRLGTEQESNTEFQAGNTITGLYGRMTIQSDGAYTYIADQVGARRLLSGEARTETFTYTISDSQDTDTGEIDITINGINDSPVAINDAFRVEEDASKFRTNVQGLIANDTDVDGDSLSITTVRTGNETSGSNPTTNNLTATGTYGTVEINEDGSYRYTADQNAADKLDEGDLVKGIFTYTLSDGESTDQAELEIEILGTNDAPILAAITDGSIAAQNNTTSLISSNLSGQLNATDADESASLSYGILADNSSRNTHTGSYGQLTIDTSTGSYTYTPNASAISNLSAGQQANDSFNIFVSDGSLTSNQSYNITVTGANYSASSGTSGGDNSGSSSTDSGATGSSDTGSTVSGSGDSGSTSNGSTGTVSSGSPDEGSSYSGSAGSGPASTGMASAELADSSFAETSLAGSDFASEAVASLMADPITGSVNSFNFENQQQPLLVASDDISGLPLTQSDDANAETSQEADTGNSDTSNLFIPSTPATESTNQFLDAIQQDISNIFSTIETKSGVRLQLPTNSGELLAPQTFDPSIRDASTIEPQAPNSDNNSQETIATKKTDSETTDHLIWQQLAPADKAGMIPFLISLKTKPQGDMIVRLRTTKLNTLGSAELEFTPEDWDQTQLIWIDTNQIEFQGETTTLKLEVELSSAANSDKDDIETLNITIQKPTLCTELSCGEATAQTKEVDHEDDPNLDLELSTIVEERSAFFLLLRASLSPFLVLTNMALHMIRQLQPEEATQVAKLELNSSAESSTIQRQASEIQPNNIRFFDPNNSHATSQIATPNPLIQNQGQIGAEEHAFSLTNIPTPFEGF